MKKSLLLSTMVVALVFALVGGATFAYFTDTATNTGNEFTAGTLDLSANRDQGDSIDGPMFYVNESEGTTYDGLNPPIGPPDGPGATGYWAPGDTHHRVFQIENVGSLDAWLKSVSASLESGSSDLAGILQVKVTSDPEGVYELVSGTLNEFLGAGKSLIDPDTGEYFSLASLDLANLHFWVTLPITAGNEYKGLTAKVSFQVKAEQMANNP